MKIIQMRLPMFLICILPLCGAGYSQELPCDVGPRTIRAFSLANSNSICLVWPRNEYRLEVRVARRAYSNQPGKWQNWVELHSITDPVLAAEPAEYCDTNVTSGIHYEYQISALITNYVCNYRTEVGYWDYQYISTGTEVPLKDQRGKVILLVENSLVAPLASELSRLENDLIGDGYQIYRHEVATSEVTAPEWKSNVASVKALVRSDYNADTNADWSIFIVGHVPIPYSGLSSPGSHTENFGAHPADWYYADMIEDVWTDTTANDTTAAYPWNWNTPGDGKFDQSYIPSAPELRVGRIDLANMPAFGKSQVELIRQYLDRNHAWRHKQFTARDRGLIFTAGFPIDSHNIYASLFGSSTNVDLGPWLTNATNSGSSYLFAASKGSGYFTRDNQLGWTTNFAATRLYAVFTTMYGSYYGNWDSAMHPDVVLLAPLASEGYAVSTYYHENFVDVDSSAMGEAIGCELHAMGANWFRDYRARYNPFGRVVDGKTYIITERLKGYITLMGDPTLRVRMVAPPRNVTVGMDGADNVISWTAAADTNIQGYHVYRAAKTNLNDFTRLTSTPVAGRSYRDVSAASNTYGYMVRTVKLEQSANRSYYNASQGIFATAVPASKLTANFSPVEGRTLLISGEAGGEYTVEYATNLSDVTAWYPLTNLTLFGPTGSVSVGDTNPVIFYHLKN